MFEIAWRLRLRKVIIQLEVQCEKHTQHTREGGGGGGEGGCGPQDSYTILTEVLNKHMYCESIQVEIKMIITNF